VSGQAGVGVDRDHELDTTCQPGREETITAATSRTDVAEAGTHASSLPS